MSASPSDGALYGGLLGDSEIAARLTDAAEIAAMIAVERALARAEGRVGVIPAEAAAALDAGLAATAVDPATLAAGTAAAGVPVPALLAALRAQLPEAAARWLHFGATSQDVMDTGLVLRLLEILALLEARRAALAQTLAAIAVAERDTPMAGRTRLRIAAPISYGLRAAQWLQPLLDLGDRAAALRPRLARAQLGGAVGTRSAFGDRGTAVAEAFAAELGLAPAPPWHAARGAIAELGGWCADLCAALAKMAGDMGLMARDETAELALPGGGSSTLPQKRNPIAAETVVALARHAAALAGALHQAGAHLEERDGAAWTLEWLALPPLLVATGAALRHAGMLAEAAAPDRARMAGALDLNGGAALAETAAFALAATRPLPEAQALVKAALARAAAEGRPLAAILAEDAPEIDWSAALDPRAAAAPGRAAIAAILARARR